MGNRNLRACECSAPRLDPSGRCLACAGFKPGSARLVHEPYTGSKIDNRAPVCTHGVTVGTYCEKCLSTLALWEQVNMHGRGLSDAEEAIEELAIGIERVAGATEEALALVKWTRLWMWGIVVLQLVELACLIRLAVGK